MLLVYLNLFLFAICLVPGFLIRIKRLEILFGLGSLLSTGLFGAVEMILFFNKIKVDSILHVIFRGTYWLRFWSQLQRDEQAKNTLSSLRKNIEMIALELANGGWKHIYRLL